MEKMILRLHEIGAIKFGHFQLKSGLISPFYIDLRLIVSFPELLQAVAKAIWAKVASLPFDLICGVPYTALPIATALSLHCQKPMIMRRKEIKEYGTKQAIEGVYAMHQSCLIVEDLITSGTSVLETIAPIEQAGITVKEIAVLIDREQGGKLCLAKQGYQVHALISLSEMVHLLEAHKKIDLKQKQIVYQFIQQNQL